MNSKPASSSGFLAVGGVAAVLASSCCLGPLILVMMGFSGTWIGSLSALEPYRQVRDLGRTGDDLPNLPHHHQEGIDEGTRRCECHGSL
ncbi:mercuric transporter MerT family protein [Tunturiibacter gelidiferens]|uniref:mercuric transporter MerT family protein n=1 Tax=Tunturiibacter gelidiferens TaxID=3069689 RepID=UPI003D9B798B